jgi:hypothetical protein
MANQKNENKTVFKHPACRNKYQVENPEVARILANIPLAVCVFKCEDTMCHKQRNLMTEEYVVTVNEYELIIENREFYVIHEILLDGKIRTEYGELYQLPIQELTK